MKPKRFCKVVKFNQIKLCKSIFTKPFKTFNVSEFRFSTEIPIEQRQNFEKLLTITENKKVVAKAKPETNVDQLTRDETLNICTVL